MAKSLRSKRKRKVRAEKRVINAKKELVKLKEVAAKLHGIKQNTPITEIPDVEMRDSSDVRNEIVGKNAILKSKTPINAQWMNQRKIKKVKRSIKKHQSKKSGNSSGIRSRKVKKSLK